MRAFLKRKTKTGSSVDGGSVGASSESEDAFHDSLEAALHPDAHEEGGYGFTNKELLARQRGVVTEVIKEIGKKLITGHLNLINVSLPVKMFEPRSYLEKLTDVWVHPTFIRRAAETNDPVERLQYVMTWFIAGLQHSFQSWMKPFNPILGETFQAALSDGSKVFLEQISHHPPISAFQLIGPGGVYKFSGVSQPDVSFELKANSVRTQARGERHLTFPDGTKIEMEYPTYYMRGLLYTAMPRGDMTGSATFLDRKHGLQGEVNFGKIHGKESEPLLQRSDTIAATIHEISEPQENATTSGENHHHDGLKRSSFTGLSGGIKSMLYRGETSGSQQHPSFIKGRLLASGQGNWLAYLDWNGNREWTLMSDTPDTWTPAEDPLPSDSRFRKDLQALKEGDYSKAQLAKEELENKQRQDAKMRKAEGEPLSNTFSRSLSLGGR